MKKDEDWVIVNEWPPSLAVRPKKSYFREEKIMFNVTVTYASGNATSIGCASIGESLEIAKEFYDGLGCREVIIKDEKADRAWEYVGNSGGFSLCHIGEE